MKRTLAFLFALLLACAGLFGCGQKGSAPIRVDFAENTASLDPQFATGDTAVTVLTNCFEGLLRRQPDGTVVPAGAAGYTLSADGRTYTFTLRADALWSDGQPVTAADYLFAFERLLDPDYLSPYAQSFASIAGAPERIALAAALAAQKEQAAQPAPEGEEPPAEPAQDPAALRAALPALGVRARDAQTLEITLTEKNAGFPERLCATAAAPCRRDYFTQCRGRYGNGTEYLIYNGSFTVSAWEDDLLRLAPNPRSRSDFAEMPAVLLHIGRADVYGLLLSGDADISPVAYGDLAAVQKKGYTVLSRENQLWALVYNQRGGAPTASRSLRVALSACADPAAYDAAGRTPQRYFAVSSFILPGAGLGEADYAGYGFTPQTVTADAAAAREALVQAREELALSEIPALSFILPESAALSETAGYFQRQWLDTLRLYVNVYVLPDAQYRARLLSGEYDIALQLLSASGEGPDGILSAFCADASVNFCGYASAAFDALLGQAGAATQPQTAAAQYNAAEQLLWDDAVGLPLYGQSSHYALGRGVSGIALLPDGALLFAEARREK